MSIRVERIPNKRGRAAILLRKSWREGKRIRKKTLANLTDLPADKIAGIDAVFRGGVVFASLGEAVSIRRSLPHGHVAAVLGMARGLGLERMLHRTRSRVRDLALAAIVARVLSPGVTLATARQLSPAAATSSLGAVLELGPVDGNEMLAMLDWLLKRQPWIERSLARRHLSEGSTLVLYDVSSSCLEGRCRPRAGFGYSRESKRGKRPITCGLLSAANGCPVAVEVFAGNTADPKTLAAQVAKIRTRFGIDRIALVGDRGMRTTARIREEIEPSGLDWISALTSAGIRKLLQGAPPALVPDALVPDAVAEISCPDFPGERLLAYCNPRLRDDRRRKREERLQATEVVLAGIAAVHARGKAGSANRDRTWKALGGKANRRKVEKYFDITVADDEMTWARAEARIDAEARLDGIRVVRTSLGPGEIGTGAAVAADKGLCRVERGFRNPGGVPGVDPVPVCTEDQVRAHVFLCMLALHVEWHMRRALAPLLVPDADPDEAKVKPAGPVAPARVSAAARAGSKRTEEGLPVHSFRTLLQDLATLTRNEVSLPGNPDAIMPLLSEPTPVQARALALLAVTPEKTVPGVGTGKTPPPGWKLP